MFCIAKSRAGCKKKRIKNIISSGSYDFFKIWLTIQLGPHAPNKKGAPKAELTLRTSVITHGSKGELALRGTFF